MTRVAFGHKNDSLIDTPRFGRIADNRYSTTELEAQLTDVSFVGPILPSSQPNPPEVEPRAEFAVNNHPQTGFNVSNLYLPGADMTGDIYEPETDSESETSDPDVEVVSMEWSYSHPISLTYIIPSGSYLTSQITEHSRWMESETIWEETYQAKYYLVHLLLTTHISLEGRLCPHLQFPFLFLKQSKKLELFQSFPGLSLTSCRRWHLEIAYHPRRMLLQRWKGL